MNQPRVSADPLSSSPRCWVTVAAPLAISTISASSVRGTAIEANVGDEADEPSTYTVNEIPERLALIISSRSSPSGRSADESLTA